MVNLESTLRVGSLAPGELRRLADAWRIGSVLSARLLGSDSGRLRLLIDGTPVEAEMPPGGAPSTNFQVRVAALTPTPVFEILQPPGPAMLAAALRALLPQQLTQTALLAALGAIAPRLSEPRAAAAAAALPADVRTALTALLAAVPTTRALESGPALQQALRGTGPLLEAVLLQAIQTDASAATALLQSDWKAGLLRLLGALSHHARPQPPMPGAAQVPPPLARQPLIPQPRLAATLMATANGEVDPAALGRLHTHVQGALARIEIAALEAHPEAALPTWLIELPLRHGDGYDLVQLRVGRDGAAATGPDDAGAWRMGFALDLPALGAIEGEVQLSGLRIAVTLWAERAATQRRLDAVLPALATRLGAEGLRPERLFCHTGLRERPRVGSAGLLNTTA